MEENRTVYEEKYDPNECYLHEPDRIKALLSDGNQVWYGPIPTNQIIYASL